MTYIGRITVGGPPQTHDIAEERPFGDRHGTYRVLDRETTSGEPAGFVGTALPYDRPAWVGRLVGRGPILNGQVIAPDFTGDLICRGELYHIEKGLVEATPMSGKLVEVREGEQVGLFRRQDGKLFFLPAVAPREAFLPAPKPGPAPQPAVPPKPPDAVMYLTSLHMGAVSTTTTDLSDGITRTFMLETSGKAQIVQNGKRLMLERSSDDGAVIAKVEDGAYGDVPVMTSPVIIPLEGAIILKRVTSGGGLIEITFIRRRSTTPPAQGRTVYGMVATPHEWLAEKAAERAAASVMAVFPAPLNFGSLPLTLRPLPLTFTLLPLTFRF